MNKFKPLACGFHSHTHMSLDGASTCEAKILNASRQGRIADCITDHGTLAGLVDHWSTAKKLYKAKKIPNPIISIHGIEAYVIDPDRPGRVTKTGKKVHEYYHATIHFKDKWAYEYFCRLTPVMEERAVTKYGERKPLLTFEEIEGASGHITIGSSCLLGPVQKNILAGRSDLAKKYYEYLRGVAGPGNWYCECLPHIITHDWQRPRSEGGRFIPGRFVPVVQRLDSNAIDPPFDPDPCTGLVDIQKVPNQFVIEMAAKYKDPVVISLDDHFATEADYVVQCARLGNGQEKWKFFNKYAAYDSDYCGRQLKKQLGVSDKQIEEWIDNSYLFVEQFKGYELETAETRWLLPTIEMVYGKKQDTKEKLWELIEYYGKMPKKDDPQYQTYLDRVNYEISVLADNGNADFLPYLFVLEDVSRWAKQNDILFNVRGSAGGSLLVYLLDISITDPIKHDLPFERFLTLGRIKSGSLPDIDSDWPENQLVMTYLMNKYGDKTARIATDMLLRLKLSIKDVERDQLGYVRESTDFMCNNMESAPQGMTDIEWLEGTIDKNTGERIEGYWNSEDFFAGMLREYAEKNKEIWETVKRCLGICKTRGVHPGGLIIAPGPVQNYIPITVSKSGEAVTSYNMKWVELVGGVKYDFLGVSTLKALGLTLKSIKDTTGKALKWEEFPHDENVYKEIIHKDKLGAIFQLNTKTVRPSVARIKPKSIAEISSITALMRPGAMDAPPPDPNDKIHKSAADYFIACARGEARAYYIHPDLEPILSSTHGVIVYQEQVLRIFRDLAGYTFETAEEVRRGIGKKIKDVIEFHGEVLKQKCIERGWTPQQADQLFLAILANSRYSFNCSHAKSYAIVAYNGCWLKYHYPQHFWLGVLTVDAQEPEKIRLHLRECADLVLPVDIVKSHPTEWKVDGKYLRPPLCTIKGCGEKGAVAWHNYMRSVLEEAGKK